MDDSRNTLPANLELWAEDLACPICFAALQFSTSTVVCVGCGRSYPVVDGIPVLIPQRTAPTAK